MYSRSINNKNTWSIYLYGVLQSVGKGNNRVQVVMKHCEARKTSMLET
jgi:hypothetical protein